MALPDQLRDSMAVRLTVLFTAFFLFLLIAAGIGAAFGSISGIPVRTSLLAASAVQCVVAFCIPAWLAARFSSPRPWAFLRVSQKVSWRPFLGVLIVYFLALPAMNQLISWNASLHFPEWGSGIEQTLREWEDANNAVAEKMLVASTVGGMLMGVLIIGVLTGFSEELFFRGGMQRIFYKGGVGKSASVWIVALIFSAIHFQFFGFFPRLIMGAFFGYLLIWTGSIWPGVFAHALNNSIVVVSVWYAGDVSMPGIDQLGVAENGSFPIAALASVVATTLFLWAFRVPFFKYKPGEIE